MKWWEILITVVICYLLGNVHFAVIISKAKKRDVRTQGSGNPGAMNMARNFGTAMGFLTLFLDGLKGIAGALIGWLILGKGELHHLSSYAGGAYDQTGMIIGGVSVVVGHIYPVFFKFKGGKGISSTVGLCMALNPLVTGVSLALGITFIAVTKMGAVTSFLVITPPLALTALQAGSYASPYNTITPLILLMLFLLTLWAHRRNIGKLFSGKESRTSLSSKGKKP